MKKIIIVFVLLFAGMVILPNHALAYTQCGQEVNACHITEFSFTTGITPVCFQNATNISTAAGWCDILQIASNVIGLLYSLVVPLVVLMILFGGFTILTASGIEGKIKKGKAFIKSALIGAVIAFGAGIIISTVMNTIGVVDQASLMPWLF